MELFGANPLADHHLNDASNVLARAFADDPGLMYVLPDPARRSQLAPLLAGAGLRFAARCGAPLVTSDVVHGVAIWFQPDAPPPTESDFVATGISAVPELLGNQSWERLKRLLNHLDELHVRTVPEPHWYLTVLGVDPTWQRRGVGMSLMQPVFEAADREGVRCYLESPTAENTRYYAQRGFETARETVVAGSDFTISLMIRDPSGPSGLESQGAQ
jgi:GNAT superfamily N-acetyltransferase